MGSSRERRHARDGGSKSARHRGISAADSSAGTARHVGTRCHSLRECINECRHCCVSAQLVIRSRPAILNCIAYREDPCGGTLHQVDCRRPQHNGPIQSHRSVWVHVRMEQLRVNAAIAEHNNSLAFDETTQVIPFDTSNATDLRVLCLAIGAQVIGMIGHRLHDICVTGGLFDISRRVAVLLKSHENLEVGIAQQGVHRFTDAGTQARDLLEAKIEHESETTALRDHLVHARHNTPSPRPHRR